MRSAKFVLKKNKAKNRILNDFTLSSCKLRLTLTFKSQFEEFPYGEDNVFTFMLENNSAKRKAVSHCYNFLLFFLACRVDKLNIATCNTFESDAGNSTKPLEAFLPLESFRVKWISLCKITRKG